MPSVSFFTPIIGASSLFFPFLIVAVEPVSYTHLDVYKRQSMSRSTFKILFYVKKGSERANGYLPLMCRLTVDVEIKQFSCKLDAVSYTHLYGKIDDYTALGNIDRNEEDNKEEYDSKYSEEELKQLESQKHEGGAEQQRQSDRVFHRCLKSLMSSTT